MSEEERGGGGKEGINEQRKESKNIYVYICGYEHIETYIFTNSVFMYLFLKGKMICVEDYTLILTLVACGNTSAF